jgi:ABC-type polysaccharide/polyol phosphate transport system ATPase subunit
VSALASFTDAGMQGVRLRKKKQMIKGVPRVTASHDRETYWVFQGLTTSVSAGQALVLVSRDPVRTNAVLRVWADLLPIDAGEVQRPQRSLLLASPQNRWVRELSVEQTIRLLAGVYGLSDAEVERIVQPVAQTAQVNGVLHRPIEELGKQFRNQIAFAIALHAPVPVVMFDHTASMGTPDFRHECLDHLVAQRDAGKALVVATDKPKVALHVGTSAVILRGKRSDPVGVSEAAEFLIRDEVKGRKRRRRSQDDDDEDEGMEF